MSENLEIQSLLKEVRECNDSKKLFEWGHSDHPAVVLEVARSTQAPTSILDQLTRHQSILVRHAVAQNSATSLHTLKRLVDDKDMLVRDYARRNLLGRGQALPAAPTPL